MEGAEIGLNYCHDVYFFVLVVAVGLEFGCPAVAALVIAAGLELGQPVAAALVVAAAFERLAALAYEVEGVEIGLNYCHDVYFFALVVAVGLGFGCPAVAALVIAAGLELGHPDVAAVASAAFEWLAALVYGVEGSEIGLNYWQLGSQPFAGGLHHWESLWQRHFVAVAVAVAVEMAVVAVDEDRLDVVRFVAVVVMRDYSHLKRHAHISQRTFGSISTNF